MYIELDKDGEYLDIINRKPVDRTTHVLEPDPITLSNLRQE